MVFFDFDKMDKPQRNRIFWFMFAGVAICFFGTVASTGYLYFLQSAASRLRPTFWVLSQNAKYNITALQKSDYLLSMGVGFTGFKPDKGLKLEIGFAPKNKLATAEDPDLANFPVCISYWNKKAVFKNGTDLGVEMITLPFEGDINSYPFDKFTGSIVIQASYFDASAVNATSSNSTASPSSSSASTSASATSTSKTTTTSSSSTSSSASSKQTAAAAKANAKNAPSAAKASSASPSSSPTAAPIAKHKRDDDDDDDDGDDDGDSEGGDGGGKDKEPKIVCNKPLPIVPAVLGTVEGFVISSQVLPKVNKATGEVDYSEATINFQARRTNVAIGFSMLVFMIMWFFVSMIVIITIWTWKSSRRVELGLVAMSAALLYALPRLRDSQPGIPKMGIVQDMVGYTWQILIIACCMISLQINYVIRYKGKKQSRQSLQRERETNATIPSIEDIAID